MSASGTATANDPCIHPTIVNGSAAVSSAGVTDTNWKASTTDTSQHFMGGASVSSAGVFTSTVATGTAPLSVTSTTPVTNLSIGGTATNVTGMVTIANGGTGAATSGAYTVFGNFTGSTAAPGFTAAPTFSAANLTNFPTFNQNTSGYAAGLAGGALGSIPYQSAANTTTYLVGYGANYYPLLSGTGAPTWGNVQMPNASCTSGGLVYASGTNATSCYNATFQANTLPKLGSSAGQPPVFSSVVDGGTDVVTTEPIFSASGSTTLTPASGIGTTPTSTGVAFPPTYATTARVYRGTCHMIWQQITAVSTVTFSVANSVAPTAEYVTSQTSAGAYLAPFVAANITSTTTTAVSSAIAPSAFATNYTTDIYLFGSFTAAANTVTIYATSGSGTDTITIQPGSYCTWLP